MPIFFWFLQFFFAIFSITTPVPPSVWFMLFSYELRFLVLGIKSNMLNFTRRLSVFNKSICIVLVCNCGTCYNNKKKTYTSGILFRFIFPILLSGNKIKFLFSSFFVVDVPTQMPPLTPGTNKKMIEVLKESFKSWEEAAQDRNITKGKYCFFVYQSLLHTLPSA